MCCGGGGMCVPARVPRLELCPINFHGFVLFVMMVGRYFFSSCATPPPPFFFHPWSGSPRSGGRQADGVAARVASCAMIAILLFVDFSPVVSVGVYVVALVFFMCSGSGKIICLWQLCSSVFSESCWHCFLECSCRLGCTLVTSCIAACSQMCFLR